MRYNNLQESLVNKMMSIEGANRAFEERRQHCFSLEVEKLTGGKAIILTFPGYKGTLGKPDYRVDLRDGERSFAASHANIIADIINKIQRGSISPKQLDESLFEIAINAEHRFQGDYRLCSPPSDDLLKRVQDGHGGKKFAKENNCFDFPINDLLLTIKWIILQEDINYPISSGYEGRKMPLARYLEAIYVASTPSCNFTIEDVVSRALSHRRPAKFLGTEIAYSRLDETVH
jgi:hypothetical protein